MFTVFVSHSSNDRTFVEAKIVPLLVSNDLQTWYATDAIRAADDWERSILSVASALRPYCTRPR